MEHVATLVDRHVDAHRAFQVDTVIVDEALGLEPPALPLRDREPYLCARHFEQPVITGADFCRAVLLYQCDQPPFAEPVGAELPANVAEHQVGRAAVGGDDARDVAVGNMAGLKTYGGNLQALVEGFARLAGAASRYRAADVALVGD